jgi:hypothetical protein
MNGYYFSSNTKLLIDLAGNKKSSALVTGYGFISSQSFADVIYSFTNFTAIPYAKPLNIIPVCLCSEV